MSMKPKHLLSVFLVMLVAAFSSVAGASDVPSGPMPDSTDEFISAGNQIYVQRCSFCHGLLGDGEGPAAPYMDPRPRDFTLGTFKFRTTKSGELPTDADLFRTVSRGLKGTGMQAFDSDVIANGLSEEERWQVIAYIQTFAFEFDDPDFDPVLNGDVLTLPDNGAPYNAETIARGLAVFERAKCWECHGKLGRGDGQRSFDRQDDWGFPIRIRNVTHPWRIKAGSDVEDIYMRFSTGISGTPMPSFARTLSEEDRWDLANYIRSLQHEPTSHDVLAVLAVSGGLPLTHDDPLWNDAEPMDIRLTGQAIVPPRWQNPSIDLVTLRAMQNGTDIVFLIEWDDPFPDLMHDETAEFDAREISIAGAFNSYVEANDMIPRQLETFRDSVALQFPARFVEGTRKPHFLRGGSSDPVQLWVWKADQESGGAAAVQEANARGWRQAPSVQAEADQQVSGGSDWDQGRWSVVMTRPLVTEDRDDVQFVPGRFIPLVANVWDGSNGEHGLLMSVSSWYYLLIEPPLSPMLYVWTLLGVLVSGLFLFWLVGRVKNKETR